MQRIVNAVNPTLLRAFATLMAVFSLMAVAHAQSANGSQYTMQEIVDAGHGFFGSTSGGLAKVVENALSSNTACRTATFSARKAPARSSPA